MPKPRGIRRAQAAPSAATIAQRERRAAVVPPVEGSTTYFVGVDWDESKRSWRARCNPAKGAYGKFLGYYPTGESAARARHKHICDEGLQGFNKMDVRDAATGLMVPREKKRRREEPVAAAPTRQSTRVRKAISRD